MLQKPVQHNTAMPYASNISYTYYAYTKLVGKYKFWRTLGHICLHCIPHLPALVHKLDTFLKELTSVGARREHCMHSHQHNTKDRAKKLHSISTTRRIPTTIISISEAKQNIRLQPLVKAFTPTSHPTHQWTYIFAPGVSDT